MNEKHRENALRIFISGLNRPLSDTLFSAKPADMPTALVLAQELAANHARYQFAASFYGPKKLALPQSDLENSPHYRGVNRKNTAQQQELYPQPMDVDPSTSRFRQNSNRAVNSQRFVANRNIGPFPNNGQNHSNNQGSQDLRRSWVPDQKVKYPQQNNQYPSHQIAFEPVAKGRYESDRTGSNNNKTQRINFLDSPYLSDQILPNGDNWEKFSEVADQDIQEIPQSEDIVDQVNFLEADLSCHM